MAGRTWRMTKGTLASYIPRWRKTAGYAIAVGILALMTTPARAFDCNESGDLLSPKGALDEIIKKCTSDIASRRKETLGDDLRYGLKFLPELYNGRAEAYLRK